jgi:hypothetical protein
MTHPSNLTAALFLGLCVVLGACGGELGADDILADTDDYIDMDTPPGVQKMEEIECESGSICLLLTLDTGDECVLTKKEVEGATKKQIFERCGE